MQGTVYQNKAYYRNLNQVIILMLITDMNISTSDCIPNVAFVPNHKAVTDEDIYKVVKFLIGHSQILILTGAGISTESGIPDYRSQDVGMFARSTHKPVQYNDFLHQPYVRQRYWARNFIGWTNFSSVKPNLNHKILKQLEDLKKIEAVITQNVDGLHNKVGSKRVIELHGTAFWVVCLKCNYRIGRQEFQQVLSKTNRKVSVPEQALRPDGDIDLPDGFINDFYTPSCPKCGGILKPDIVFFGDNVPKERVNAVNDAIYKSDGLLVLGSSLSTYSGYRIILKAKELKKRVGIINIGPTRADEIADFKIDVKCSEILSKCLGKITSK